MSRSAFPKRRRLLSRADYLSAYRGRRHEFPHFILCWRKREGESRIGITVSRKVGNAVERNRLKRRLREIFRQNAEIFPCRADVVVIAKKGAAALSCQRVFAELKTFHERMAPTD